MEAEITRIGVVNARGTDGYALVHEYSDGTQSGAEGWYGSIELAASAAVGSPDQLDWSEAVEQAADDDVSLEDWTEDDE